MAWGVGYSSSGGWDLLETFGSYFHFVLFPVPFLVVISLSFQCQCSALIE